MYSLDDDLVLANELIRVASEITLSHLDAGPTSRSKADGSPVTDADEDVEQTLVRLIQDARPQDAILGEEFGRVGAADRCWIIDPIDGTFNFSGGTPHWGTHVALQIAGEIELGIVSRPQQSQSWWAIRKGGAHRDEWATSSTVKISVSHVTELAESRVAIWSDSEDDLARQLNTDVVVVDSDLNAILDVAEGRLEAAVDRTGKPWDHAPYAVLIEEAGGRYSDCKGGRRIDLGEIRYTNRGIHDAFVDLVNSTQN